MKEINYSVSLTNMINVSDEIKGIFGEEEFTYQDSDGNTISSEDLKLVVEDAQLNIQGMKVPQVQELAKHIRKVITFI